MAAIISRKNPSRVSLTMERRQVMSLRHFHIIFIVASILLSIFFGLWALQMYSQENTGGYLMTAISSFACAAGLAVYAVYFVRKILT